MKNKKGFTLFELLISISIIGILTALASISFSNAQKKARDSRRIQDMKIIQTAAEQYYSLNNYNYPLVYSGQWQVGGQTVLESFPVDPKNSDPYIYNCNGNATGYCCCALVEGTGSANSDSVCNFNVAAANKTHFCVKNQQ